jgi:hypothetical protein
MIFTEILSEASLYPSMVGWNNVSGESAYVIGCGGAGSVFHNIRPSTPLNYLNIAAHNGTSSGRFTVDSDNVGIVLAQSGSSGWFDAMSVTVTHPTGTGFYYPDYAMVTNPEGTGTYCPSYLDIGSGLKNINLRLADINSGFGNIIQLREVDFPTDIAVISGALRMKTMKMLVVCSQLGTGILYSSGVSGVSVQTTGLSGCP